MVVVAIVLLLLVVIGGAYRSVMDANVEAKAINTLTSFASVARAYAMRHRLETVLTIDPNTGQLEMWVWDTVGNVNVPLSDPNFVPPNSRYVYAPILDDTARLPRKGGNLSENLAVRIAPIECDNGTPQEPRDDPNNAAFARVAMCFDPAGRLVVRNLTLVYELNGTQIPNPPHGGRVVAIRPGWLDVNTDLPINPFPQPTDSSKWWFQITTCRGGIAYTPPEGRQVWGGGPADPYDPATLSARADPKSKTPFMLNPYSGRIVQEATP